MKSRAEAWPRPRTIDPTPPDPSQRNRPKRARASNRTKRGKAQTALTAQARQSGRRWAPDADNPLLALHCDIGQPGVVSSTGLYTTPAKACPQAQFRPNPLGAGKRRHHSRRFYWHQDRGCATQNARQILRQICATNFQGAVKAPEIATNSARQNSRQIVALSKSRFSKPVWGKKVQCNISSAKNATKIKYPEKRTRLETSSKQLCRRNMSQVLSHSSPAIATARVPPREAPPYTPQCGCNARSCATRLATAPAARRASSANSAGSSKASSSLCSNRRPTGQS